MDHNDAVEKVVKEFDTSHDSQVDLKEFIAGVGKWLEEAKGANDSNHAADSMKFIDAFHVVCCFKQAFLQCLSTSSDYHFVFPFGSKQRDNIIFWDNKVKTVRRVLRTRSGLHSKLYCYCSLELSLQLHLPILSLILFKTSPMPQRFLLSSYHSLHFHWLPTPVRPSPPLFSPAGKIYDLPL